MSERFKRKRNVNRVNHHFFACWSKQEQRVFSPLGFLANFHVFCETVRTVGSARHRIRSDKWFLVHMLLAMNHNLVHFINELRTYSLCLRQGESHIETRVRCLFLVLILILILLLSCEFRACTISLPSYHHSTCSVYTFEDWTWAIPKKIQPRRYIVNRIIVFFVVNTYRVKLLTRVLHAVYKQKSVHVVVIWRREWKIIADDSHVVHHSPVFRPDLDQIHNNYTRRTPDSTDDSSEWNDVR